MGGACLKKIPWKRNGSSRPEEFHSFSVSAFMPYLARTQPGKTKTETW
jgi:hypothetical protein